MQALIRKSRIVLFIFGTLDIPEGKPSRELVEMVEKHFPSQLSKMPEEELSYFDLLTDPAIGEELKQYSRIYDLP